MLCPVPPPNGCSVCGPRRCIQNPDNRFGFPGAYELSCRTLQQGGFDGLVDPTECEIIVPYVDYQCGCGYFVPSTPAPTQHIPAPVPVIYPTKPSPTTRPLTASGGSMGMMGMSGRRTRTLGAAGDRTDEQQHIEDVVRALYAK
jgi:hypothetical protein